MRSPRLVPYWSVHETLGVDARMAPVKMRRRRMIGYLPVNQTGAMLFFQLINRRYERASTVLTSNKGFEEWGDVLGDEVMAAALIDRLLHHCHIVNIRGNSYRIRHHTELSKVLHSPPAESSSSPPRKRRRTSKETTTT